MITNQLIAPKSIAVVGGTDNIAAPGGKVLKNLIDSNFNGNLYVVNLKQDTVQGIKSYSDPADLPQVDLAIIAIAAKFCVPTVEIMAKQKGTKAFIILSAGFSEESEEGANMERQIVEIIEETGGCLIGPNCIGVINPVYSGAFTTPIPTLTEKGVDFVSGSGATAVFIMEAAIPKGLTFSSIYSVGNSAQTGVEDILEYWDNSFNAQTSSKVKLIYVESINKPDKLLKHAASLIRKGCKIAAIKAGSSEAGSRAASSHTGALASPDLAVDALFRKAGIVRCYGREELTNVACVFMHKELKGKNIAVITHAGGPAVMLTDALSNGGLEVPPITSPKSADLLNELFPGSSVANPIDFLATGNAEQLGKIIDYCDNEFDEIDAMVVIFGSPGLFGVSEVYQVLDEKMKTCKKPIYPSLPSIINAEKEIKEFISNGRMFFPDEVSLGTALAKVASTPAPAEVSDSIPNHIDVKTIRSVIDAAENGYLPPEGLHKLLDAAGISRTDVAVLDKKEDVLNFARKTGYPLVMKVVGPVHKSDVGGVVLNIKNEETVAKEFDRLMTIQDTYAIEIYKMLFGTEVFIGAMREEGYGHQVLCGLGGIFVEVLKDVQVGLAPLSLDEAKEMIKRLRGYGIIKGARKQEPVNEELYAQAIVNIGALLKVAPEIFEMDLNPLLGNTKELVAVDARIRIEK